MTDTIKLQGPDNCGGFSCNGTTYQPDADGCIGIPPELGALAASHGFLPVGEVSDSKVDFSKLTKKQLIAFGAENLGLTLDPTATNKDLIAQIETALAATATPQE